MTAKKPAKKGAAVAAPESTLESVRNGLQQGWLSPYPEHVQEALRRLVNDPGMKDLWKKDFNKDDFRQAVFAFDQATGRDEWDRTPQRERDLWWADFEATANRLLSLMSRAPTPPAAWGFPIKMDWLQEYLRVVGLPIPERGTEAYYQSMQRHDEIADSIGLDISHILRHYILNQKAQLGPRQMLRKPRDPKSDRARFIVAMCRYTYCTNSVIATVAGIVFEDANIDAQLVRRLRPDSLENEKNRTVPE